MTTSALLDAFDVVGHPTRARILVALRDRGEPMSPMDLTRVIDASLGTVAYHVRVLARGDDGLIRQTRERRVRGAVEHFYVLTAAGRRAVEGMGL